MRVAVIYRPREAPPLDQIPALLQAMAQFRERYGDRWDVEEWFPVGGGLAIGDVDDSAELLRIAAEHPFTPYTDVEIRPVVAPDKAMEIYQDVLGGEQASG